LAKAPFPILVTLAGMIILGRLKQFRKAESPMLLIPFCNVMLVRLSHLLKAAPMVATLPGIVILLRLVNQSKALV